MKKIFIIVLLAFSAHAVFAQNQTDVEMTKNEKKRAELEEKFQFVKEMLEDKNFVLDADEKKKTFRLSLGVLTSIGAYDVHFFINPHGQATARLSGIRAGSLTFEGDIVALENSVVYEGHSL